MKAVYGLLAVFILVGGSYLAAFFGIIPAQKIANGSPAAAKILIAMRLAKPKAKLKLVVAATPPANDPAKLALADGQKQLAADRAKLDQDKAAFEASKTANAAGQPPSASGVYAAAASDTQSKLISIYATMPADSLAQIMQQQPDKVAIAGLMALDEKKAGKVLAAFPPDRAAKISMLMSHLKPMSTASASIGAPAVGQPVPKTTLQ